MSLSSKKEKILSDGTPLDEVIVGFEHVNRYVDRRENKFIAKILPGEFYVTRSHTELIATTLGSCVSACIWDEENSIGGMNHFMLPLSEVEAHKITWGNVASDATRYGNYAMEHLINEILTHGGIRRNLKAKVFGGGKVLNQGNEVGLRNAEFVLTYLHQENIDLIGEDLGDVYPRKILFNPLTGKARMKKIRELSNNTIVSRERQYSQNIQHEPVEGDIELF
ncbi:chemoreceptor glutamine deamidase CheD [Sessilibacter corallicola]|uniref:Probable chemoreceptor glutamine deamidase CheD n=1 Tax=Sessilibacter corallicola TaxID=2904075 RepID=A0ABQ0ABW1_9GAMM